MAVRTDKHSAFKEFLMRYTPLAAALSLFAAITASTGYGQASKPVDPRVEQLLDSGRAALAHGDLSGATDRFEAALVLAPGYAPTYIDLGEVARAKGLQGRAIHYYREALELEPGSLAAISGEGAAMVEKGAVVKAQQNLAKLKSLCGETCIEVSELSAVIARGPIPRVKSAEAKPTDNMAEPVEIN
jgi:Flp pilus assembly protein TadD